MTAPFTDIATYYDRLVDHFGHDPRACDYGRAQSQAVKFQVLSEAADFSGRSVLDVGCGFADFAGFLQQRFEQVRYSGIDLSPRMMAKAKELRPDLHLQSGNVLDLDGENLYDIVTANGIFYLLGNDAQQTMQQMIRRMFRLARAVVAFNSLSSWAGDPEPGEFYADPLETVAFCRSLSPWVALRHDYHPRDFTIYLYKERNCR